MTARGPKPKYTTRFNMVLTPLMRVQIEEAADAAGVTTSTWVRNAIRAALKVTGAG